ncbi:hypothetical protein BHM03_00023871 [Ensete ventricosum]|nr:hypothetical protein BHM03_00023871 [Ensete ventricosum]
MISEGDTVHWPLHKELSNRARGPAFDWIAHRNPRRVCMLLRPSKVLWTAADLVESLLKHMPPFTEKVGDKPIGADLSNVDFVGLMADLILKI